MTMIIDTDSHAVEAPNTWTDRMSSKWGDAVPHVRYVPEQKSDVWFVGDIPVMHAGFSVVPRLDDLGVIGRREEDYPAFITVFDEMHPSSFDPDARVKVMDKLGITAAVLYPNLGFIGPEIYRTLPGTPLEYQVEVASAYNDWVLDWARAQPGRFVPLACIPYWDVPSAVREIERCAELGHHGFVTTGAPELHGEPFLSDHHWDPVWAAAQASGLPISFHAGGGGQGMEQLRARMSVEGWTGSMVRANTVEFLRNGMTAADLIMSGVLPRFPGLKFITVESGIGWIPFVLESLDWHFERYDLRTTRPEFKEKPSFYFRRQVYANTWFENVTQWHVDNIGADNLLFETDYPHPTCLMNEEVGNTIQGMFTEVSDEVRDKVLWKNAANLFKLDLAR